MVFMGRANSTVEILFGFYFNLLINRSDILDFGVEEISNSLQ